VIFDLRDESAGGGFVVGAMLQASVIRHVGAVDLLGVRFVPGAAPLFLGTAAAELTGTVIPASAIGVLATALLECDGTSERITLLNQYLLERLRPADASATALQGMALIERARGLLRVELLCRSLGVSERTLQRTFAAQVGLTPKQAIRIMRFRRAVALLRASPRGSLATIAHSCGYADQAHFTREFRELAAISPTDYTRETGIVGFLQDAPTGPP
jgi:AraC-like DNA-binding protein